MPQRFIPFITNQFYHVFNRSINKEPIFVNSSDCHRSITTLDYYKRGNTPIRLSYFLALGVDRRHQVLKTAAQNSSKLVDIISFCLMPNHFHLLLRQTQEEGISKFLALFQNSFTRFFNTKYKRQGHLFQGQFKAVRIEDQEQLVHVNRYIHLNPYSSYIVKTIENLLEYPHSSLPEYLSNDLNCISNKDVILSQFSSVGVYKKFLFDQADYQRSLERTKHLILE